MKCSGSNKWRIGSGKCIYKNRASAERAYKGYLGAKWGGKKFVVSPSEVHVPVPLPNLSIRGWGKKEKKKKKYSFLVYNIENVK